MEWTYWAYTGVSISISCALVLFVAIGVTFSYCYSKTGEEFINKRVIGIDPPKMEDDPNKKGSRRRIVVSFCILAIMIISTAAVLIFEGCFLANARLLPDDDCPDYPMDCFVFNRTADDQPIEQSASFHCLPSNKAQIPSSVSNGKAVCYGWIIKLQTTKNILDQFGIALGLFGLHLCAALSGAKDVKNDQSTPQPDESSINVLSHVVVPIPASSTPKTTTATPVRILQQQSKVFPESTTSSNI
ncbi:unnamed protein product [Adineta steineri]|uniref:Uncharacterized protein n=1 Tax=Adineta steineri TaxID=433720 RepID=A0A818I4Z1_9BILA|nr:unnamed protein product [Adineta steineri]CAF3520155.1 unnamed protein product [Adineta steineri]